MIIIFVEPYLQPSVIQVLNCQQEAEVTWISNSRVPNQ